MDGKVKVKLTTIDAMWVLIQPLQVDDREEISAELLGAWLFSKVEGKSMVLEREQEKVEVENRNQQVEWWKENLFEKYM